MHKMKREKALSLFQRLRNFWGVSIRSHTFEHGYSGERCVATIREEWLNPRVQYARASWMPVLKKDWIRPNFQDFLNLYDIYLEGII